LLDGSEGQGAAQARPTGTERGGDFSPCFLSSERAEQGGDSGAGAERDPGCVAHRRPIRFLGVESQRTRRPNSLRIFIKGREGGPGPCDQGRPYRSPGAPGTAGRERCACVTWRDRTEARRRRSGLTSSMSMTLIFNRFKTKQRFSHGTVCNRSSL
jgi:hypothetical protein